MTAFLYTNAIACKKPQSEMQFKLKDTILCVNSTWYESSCCGKSNTTELEKNMLIDKKFRNEQIETKSWKDERQNID